MRVTGASPAPVGRQPFESWPYNFEAASEAARPAGGAPAEASSGTELPTIAAAVAYDAKALPKSSTNPPSRVGSRTGITPEAVSTASRSARLLEVTTAWAGSSPSTAPVAAVRDDSLTLPRSAVR